MDSTTVSTEEQRAPAKGEKVTPRKRTEDNHATQERRPSGTTQQKRREK